MYKGDANNAVSSSPVINQVVLQTTSSATIMSSPNPSGVCQAVTLYRQDLVADSYADRTGLFHIREHFARYNPT